MENDLAYDAVKRHFKDVSRLLKECNISYFEYDHFHSQLEWFLRDLSMSLLPPDKFYKSEVGFDGI